MVEGVGVGVRAGEKHDAGVVVLSLGASTGVSCVMGSAGSLRFGSERGSTAALESALGTASGATNGDTTDGETLAMLLNNEFFTPRGLSREELADVEAELHV